MEFDHRPKQVFLFHHQGRLTIPIDLFVDTALPFFSALERKYFCPFFPKLEKLVCSPHPRRRQKRSERSKLQGPVYITIMFVTVLGGEI